MKITVLTWTYRGLDQLERRAESLRRQTLPHEEFEWVIVDDHYDDHKAQVAAWDMSFRVTHVPPRNPTPYSASGAAVNSGLIYSQGELVFLMADYVQPFTDVLLRHWQLYERYGPKVVISGPLIPWECPECAVNSGRGYAMADEAFVALCQTCSSKMVMFRARNAEYLIPHTGEGEIFSPGMVQQTFLGGRNDSVSLEAALAVNGMDERLDGYFLGLDIDFAVRLMNAGCRYIVDRLLPCILHPHTRGKLESPGPASEGPGQVVIQKEVLEGQSFADHGWSIRDERTRLGL